MLKFKSKIIILFFLSFFTHQSYAEEKIAYIDLDKLFKESNYGKQITQTLNVLNAKNIEDLKKKESILKKKEDEINSKKNIISADEYNNEVENFKIEINKYRKEKKQLVDNFQKIKNDEIKSFFLKINPLLETFMNENSVEILLDKKFVLVGKSKLDITDKFIKKINENIE